MSTAAGTRLIPPRGWFLQKPLDFVRQGPKVSLVVLFLVLVAAGFGRWVVPHGPREAELSRALQPPAWMKGGSWQYPLGTDKAGRDMVSRIVVGTEVSAMVGFTAVGVAGFIGTVVALLAGYLGGWVDALLMRLTDASLSMPFLLIAMIFVVMFGPGLDIVILSLALVLWANYARVLRSEVLRLKEADFVKLALVAGMGTPGILFRHIFPNIINTLTVLATLQLGITIIAEAGLSFLGLGVPPPRPTWGGMLADGRDNLTTAWWLATFPGLAILMTVLSINHLGDWLRFRLDPKYRQQV